ncbi:membrane protein [[Clostridium] sordellii]|uniref:YIEGIA domain-containing protein n=1 Tax=Paraclostridium sordellii TaxID=1505 RepID=UPI0005E24491|nr:YIEGIA domain-containing protein [Paeniclostridium sordellii]AUN14541.1 YIEGIA protein [Paeniclostridium sordellii]MDU5021514.1 YIEGIA domain-containing protein [Clostridiales bacterium]CEN75354.1 membrane protein [[Clostridium] sordellii] [Paeniclostridium sordellii]
MNVQGIISQNDVIVISTAIIMGTMARVMTLKEDYRQYPSYPNGYFTHVVLGVIAAAIGAVAIPALLAKNFTAVTFLTIAIQQFRDVRKTEISSLKSLENTEFTTRGDAYIDGIAKTFESRNYLGLTVSFITSLSMIITSNISILYRILIGICIGSITYICIRNFTKGKQIQDIADVKIAKVDVRNSELYVDDIYVTNSLGTENSRNIVRNEAMAAIITPKSNHFRITLDNYGQRQAILFEACRALGVKRYQFTRKEYNSGKVVIVLVPIIRDEEFFIKVVKETPLLENVRKSHRLMKENI